MLEELRENLEFVGISIAVFIGLLLLAIAAEKWIVGGVKKPPVAKRVAYIGMFAALAGALMCLEIPLFFAPSFYQLDLSEIPVMICAFSMGPVSGVVCELIKVVVKLLIKGTSTAFVGDFANFVVGCSMVLPAAVVYHKVKTKKGAVISLVCGGVVMTVFGSLFNAIYLIPAFANLYGIPIDTIIGMGAEVNGSITSVATLVLFAVVPFNLVKAVVVSVVTMLLYKRVKRIIKMG